MSEQRATYLPMSSLIVLDYACAVVKKAFGSGLYLVGSCLERADYRDVDVRAIIDDDEYASLFSGRPTLWPLICLSVSEYLSRVSGLPVDFQIQAQTEADEFKGVRNPISRNRDYAGYVHRAVTARRVSGAVLVPQEAADGD